MSLRTQSSLDVNDDELQRISSESSKLVIEYLASISERPVRAENHAGKTLAAIKTELSSEGRPVQELIEECRTVMDLSRHNGHPRFFGYVASPSTQLSTQTSRAGVQARREPRSNEWSCAGSARSLITIRTLKAY